MSIVPKAATSFPVVFGRSQHSVVPGMSSRASGANATAGQIPQSEQHAPLQACILRM